MKVLFCATYGDFLATFELSNIKIWQDLGCEVHCASNFSQPEYNQKTDKLHEIGTINHEVAFSRSPMDIKNIKEFNRLVQLMKTEQIDVVDCHNAVIGVYARLAAQKCKINKVIYTPHSLFFYQGCPLKNKIVYKNIEFEMAKITDLFVAINQEDYRTALKMRLRGKALYVPGVGVDTEEMRILKSEREKYRKEFDVPSDAKIFVSVGELIPRKNHAVAIRAFAEAELKNAYYIICGIGQLKGELEKLIKQLKMEEKVKLLGYRSDVKSIMKSADVFVFPSHQEGLPVALMEAMGCGLPCIASRIRGNVDLIDEGKGGYLYEADDVERLKELLILMCAPANGKKMGEYNENKVKAYDIKNVREIMKREYENMIS